jgi:hypothetical protein
MVLIAIKISTPTQIELIIPPIVTATSIRIKGADSSKDSVSFELV